MRGTFIHFLWLQANLLLAVAGIFLSCPCTLLLQTTHTFLLWSPSISIHKGGLFIIAIFPSSVSETPRFCMEIYARGHVPCSQKYTTDFSTWNFQLHHLYFSEMNFFWQGKYLLSCSFSRESYNWNRKWNNFSWNKFQEICCEEQSRFCSSSGTHVYSLTGILSMLFYKIYMYMSFMIATWYRIHIWFPIMQNYMNIEFCSTGRFRRWNGNTLLNTKSANISSVIMMTTKKDIKQP